MSFTQFAMVEELAFLVKDNLPCKHLILSMEDALVDYLQDEASLDGVLELEPMNPYNRLLVHRLADIFGVKFSTHLFDTRPDTSDDCYHDRFSHKSVGEGEDRHLILERCPETSIPSILVSDLLWQFGEDHSPMICDVLSRKEVLPVPSGHKDTAGSKSSLENKERAYLAARERIFSADICDSKLVKQRPQKDPVVARRMITRALGQTNKEKNHEMKSSDMKKGRESEEMKIQTTDGEDIHPSKDLEINVLPSVHPRPFTMSGVPKLSQSESSDSDSGATQQRKNMPQGGFGADGIGKSIQETSIREEHMGAARRLFAHALGMDRQGLKLSKCDDKKKTCG